MKWIICLFKGHKPITKKRKKELEYSYAMLGLDVYGFSAFGNMERMDEIMTEIKSCTFCGRQIIF